HTHPDVVPAMSAHHKIWPQPRATGDSPSLSPWCCGDPWPESEQPYSVLLGNDDRNVHLRVQLTSDLIRAGGVPRPGHERVTGFGDEDPAVAEVRCARLGRETGLVAGTDDVQPAGTVVEGD